MYRIHLGKALSTALAVALLPEGAASAQTGAPSHYIAMSRSVASAFGRTWQLGKQCGVVLDGLSRAAAGRLFDHRLENGDIASVLGAYDEGARSAAAETCERRALAGEISRSDQLLRRYLQVPAPLNRIEISSPPSRSF